MYIIVTINILCQLIFLSLFTPETLKEDQETGGPGQLSLKSLRLQVYIILYTSSVRTECTTVQYVIDKREWM